MPVQSWAEANKIPFQTVNKQSLLTLTPASYRFDLLVSVSFGLFIPAGLVNSAPHTINVHPSLLPQYRGPAPIHNAILNGDRHTGVTLQTISSKGFDRGVIFDQSFPIAIKSGETFNSLWERLADLGAQMLISAVQKRSYINPQPIQTFTEESYGGIVHKQIDFNEIDSARLERLSRLCAPVTGAIDIRTGKRELIQISGISTGKISNHRCRLRPGTWSTRRHPITALVTMTVVCSDGKMVYVEKVKVSGRDWVRGDQFVRTAQDRFWGSGFVPYRKEYDEHDPTEYRYRASTPVQTKVTYSIENTTKASADLN